ncbi:MAG: PorT family protein [Muribaculaceae bacterium]|nr:PorT family protein [Muribaculaceae bacterium]
MRRFFSAIIITIVSIAPVYAQRHYSPNVAIGGKAGATMSSIAFNPDVQQSMVNGLIAGVTFRYTEEKHVGLMAEINIEQRGWKEDFEEYPFSYERKLTYIQVPLLTHIFFGGRKFKGFINLGPEVSYMLGESTNANFNYNNIPSVPGFPTENRMTEQLYTKVKNKFDYGISAGIGMEYLIKRRHSIMLEGRYYFGLGNIYPDNKRDTFSASRGSTISITLSYMYRLK